MSDNKYGLNDNLIGVTVKIRATFRADSTMDKDDAKYVNLVLHLDDITLNDALQYLAKDRRIAFVNGPNGRVKYDDYENGQFVHVKVGERTGRLSYEDKFAAMSKEKQEAEIARLQAMMK